LFCDFVAKNDASQSPNKNSGICMLQTMETEFSSLLGNLPNKSFGGFWTQY